MTKILKVGKSSDFGIESGISRAYERLSQRALGFFVLKVGGRTYGVRSPEATLLACSFDAVKQRLERRGQHTAAFAWKSAATEIVYSVIASMYEETSHEKHFLGMPAPELRTLLTSKDIIWAPDGDAAFDDGGHVLQFDCDERVRLIAFRNAGDERRTHSSISDVWLEAEKFYGLLADWSKRFEAAWREMLLPAH